jgi:hypothetical protein
MSSMKLSRPSSAWLVLTLVGLRPVKPSSASVDTPRSSALRPVEGRRDRDRDAQRARGDGLPRVGLAAQKLCVRQGKRVDRVQLGVKLVELIDDHLAEILPRLALADAHSDVISAHVECAMFHQAEVRPRLHPVD